MLKDRALSREILRFAQDDGKMERPQSGTLTYLAERGRLARQITGAVNPPHPLQ